jgi:hypothetical protein
MMILVRVVSHNSMVLGREVGEACITITDIAAIRFSQRVYRKENRAIRIRSCAHRI